MPRKPASCLFALFMTTGRRHLRTGALAMLAGVLTALGGEVSSPAASDTVVLRENGPVTTLEWRGDKIAELKNYRHLRFRPSGFNDHWLGTKVSPMDLCWSYADVNDYVVQKTSFEATATGFTLTIEATKPSVKGVVVNHLKGRFISEEKGFEYVLSSRLSADQTLWRKVSKRAARRKPSEALAVEPLDYHLNRISPSDRNTPGNPPGDADLYDAIVLSKDGITWRSVPKIPMPAVARQGHYPTIEWNHDEPATAGYKLGYLDRREGGWMTEVKDTSSPLSFDMCWMLFDVHHLMRRGVPPSTGQDDRFDAHYALQFTPLTAPEAGALLDRATPIAWRDRAEYQLPVFSRYNNFDRLIANNNDFAWFASSSHCQVDREIGYDDRASVRIVNNQPGDHASWYAWTWGPEYDTQQPLEGRYRFTAMVKTKGCTGPVHLRVAEHFGDSWRLPNGKWSNPEMKVHLSSSSITGTTDWKRLTVDVEIDNRQFAAERDYWIRRSIILQHDGVGTVWFDNVSILKVD